MSTYMNPFGKNNNQFDDCPLAITEFLNYITGVKALSQRTVNGYYIDLRNFFRFIKSKKIPSCKNLDINEIEINDVDYDLIKSITQSDIYNYLSYCVQTLSNNEVTRARKLSSIRAFFKFLTTRTNKLENNPVKDIDTPKIKKRLPKYLSLEECLELLSNVESKYYERDYCILVLFLNCGMRLSELVGININSFKENTINIIGKGNKERKVFLNNACIEAINNYLVIRNSLPYAIDKDALFISERTGKRLTPRRVQQIVEENIKMAGLADLGYSVHKLRHTAATLMYRHGGADMLALKEILGHEHVTTTEIYTHINSDKLQSAVDKSPLSKVKMNKKPSKNDTNNTFNDTVNEIDD